MRVTQHPLAPMQRGMLVESLLGERPGLNLEQLVVRLDERLDAARLEGAFRELSARHDVLRARFLWDGAEPALEVHPSAPVTLHRRRVGVDGVEAFLARDRARGVRLDELPPMRWTLLEHDEGRGTLVWTFHHALLDGRAFTLALEEAFALYDGETLGPPPPPFREHVEAAAAVDLEAAERHFRARLAGYDETLRLPIDGGNAEPRPHRDAELRLDAASTEALTAMAEGVDATLYTALLAGWAIVLGRYAGRDDVLFGTTLSGRHTVPEAKRMLGCFINTLPVRARLNDATVGSLVRAIRADLLASRPFEQTPLDRVGRWSELPRGAPLLTTNVVFERYLLGPHLRARGGPWAHRHVEVREEGSFPLTLAAYLHDGMVLRLEHDPGRFSESAMERMLGHLACVLEEMATDAERPLEELRLMSAEEERGRLVAARPRAPIATSTESYVDLFEASVAERPSAPAVRRPGGESVSYAALDARANQLARHLAALGAGPEVRVAIALGRDVPLTVAVLAVLKAGAAYVPLDPRYPESALRHMLEDSGARILLVDDARPVDEGAAQVVDLTRDADAIAAHEATPPPRDIRPDTLAYVIYTSGSTGRPKGVMVEHRSLVSHNLATVGLFALAPSDRVLQFASFSFDVAIEEMLPTWIAGAEVVLRTDAMAQSIGELLVETSRSRLTVLNLPTAFWHELVPYLEDTGARLPGCVRLVIVGGEKASAAAFARWRALHPELRWLNGYGPTEATITSTVYEPPPDARPDPLPIGRPTANARAYVLDPHRRPTPVGVPGELFIGGAAVARGYLGREALTAERFVDDPFEAGRMYATGDRARWREDDELEYLGRLDRQIKVRGFRIEPGEVEQALAAHPEVDEAVVDARQGRLLAWVVAPGLEAGALKDHLRGRLPPHMIPAAIVRVEALPKSPGGKVDLGGLTEPVEVAPTDDVDAGPRARELAALFAETLERSGFGVDESFFDAGGHSLLALRLLRRVERELDLKLTAASLMAAPTPRELAALLESDAPQWECLVPLQPEGHRPPLYAIDVLGENGSYFHPLAKELGREQPIYGVRLPLRDEDKEVIEEIAATYIDEILRFQPEGPYHLLAVSLGGTVAYEVARQLDERGREVGLLGMLDALGPGGMQSVGRLERARRHLRGLRREGPSYAMAKVRERVHRLGEDLAHLKVRIASRLGLDSSGQLELDRLVDAKLEAALVYEYPPYRGRLTVFRATDDIFYTDEFLRAGLGWSACVEGGVRVIDVAGDHLGMLSPPHVSSLARAIESVLAEPLVSSDPGRG